MSNAIIVTELWKRYRLRVRTLADLAGDLVPWRRRMLRPLRRAFWALQDVSFRVDSGTSLGLIGANGSGKSTLLKLIAGIMTPTRGSLAVRGRLALLAHLGSGFHGDLTGRENVFLQGAILGLRRAQLRSKLDAILAFAELEAFADVPVKFYSSGMALRLGFAIAAHVEPEILLIDEAFAVGDVGFRDRCLERIRAFRAAGITLVLVSHERYLLEQLCDRAILLDHGRLVAEGPLAAAFEAYEQLSAANAAGTGAAHLEGDPALAPLTIEGVELVGAGREAAPLLPLDASLTLRIRLRATRDVEGAAVGIQIARDAHVLHGTRSNRQGIEIRARAGERLALEIEYPRVSLMRGLYALHVSVLEHPLAQLPTVTLRNAARFSVTHGEAEGVGLVRLEHVWRRVPA
ncbi:MAG TPA: ABC transporter ATP-binding protein [Gemmatimonadales bacterium]|nr:ABC transporter ATP-binding protein [Gemmatimonadales bacterium]